MSSLGRCRFVVDGEVNSSDWVEEMVRFKKSLEAADGALSVGKVEVGDSNARRVVWDEWESISTIFSPLNSSTSCLSGGSSWLFIFSGCVVAVYRPLLRYKKYQTVWVSDERSIQRDNVFFLLVLHNSKSHNYGKWRDGTVVCKWVPSWCRIRYTTEVNVDRSVSRKKLAGMNDMLVLFDGNVGTANGKYCRRVGGKSDSVSACLASQP